MVWRNEPGLTVPLVSVLRIGGQYFCFVAEQTDKGLVAQGKALYTKDGCVNCHGEAGRGGVPNPQSPDKAIPPLSGVDFFQEFNTDKKITDVIRSGSVLGRAPIVSMPHWGGILSDQQLRALVAYIKTLKTA